MAHEEPISRNEAYLQNALGKAHELGEPQSRLEELLAELVEAIQQGGGGTKLYQHNISLSDTSMTVHIALAILNSDNNAFTLSSLASYLYNKGFTDNEKTLTATGSFLVGGSNCIMNGVFSLNGIYAYARYSKSNGQSDTAQMTSFFSIKDIVIEI